MGLCSGWVVAAVPTIQRGRNAKTKKAKHPAGQEAEEEEEKEEEEGPPSIRVHFEHLTDFILSNESIFASQ